MARAARAHPALGWVGIAIFSPWAALCGTLLHRSGADRNIPWGLVAGLLLLFCTALWARRVHGFLGVAVSLLLSSTLIWIVASGYGPGGDILVPISSPAFTTFWSRWAGYAWLFGSTLVQLLSLAVPKRLFGGRR